ALLDFPRQRCCPARTKARFKFNLTACACPAFEPSRERAFQSCGETSVHFDELFSRPGFLLISRQECVEAMIVPVESHGRAAWRSGADKSITRTPFLVLVWL